MAGKNSLTRRKCDSVFTSRVRATEASEVDRIERGFTMPALLKSKVGAPSFSRILAAVAETVLGEVTSHS